MSCLRKPIHLCVALLVVLASAVLAQDTPPTAAEAVAAPEVSLSSPAATMESFLKAINRVNDGYDDAWSQVFACFDVELTTRADRRNMQRIARQLLDVLDRLGKVKPQDDLPNDYALQQRVSEGREPLRRYQFFPDPRFAWVWEKLGELGQAPQGKITLVVGENGRWRFSAATVADISQLNESTTTLPPRYIDTGIERRSEVLALLGPTFDRTPLWAWGTLLLGIFLGLLVGKFAQALLRGIAKRLDNRGWTVRATVFRNAANPASLALLSAGLLVGLSFVVMEPRLHEFANNILAFLFILAAGWFLFNLVDVIELALLHLTAKTATKLDDMVVPLIRKTLRIFLVIIFTLVVAQNIFGLNITGWLAGLGIAGLAVSLAAQDSIKNLFGSVTIFFDKPFLVGDFITFGGDTGTVEEIGFRSTRIRLLSGHLVTVPNMQFIDNKVENIAARPYIRRQMDVTITYDTPPQKIEKAVDILRDVLHDPQVVEQGRFNMQDNPPRIAFNELNADSLNIRAYYWYQMAGDPNRGFFTFLEHCQLVNMKLFRRYEEAGIDFAFPTQTLYLAGDPNRRLSVHIEPPEGTSQASS
ncbi:MAG: mechanosensitive ion channel family protein [Phycisphaeraceae bacterium]